MGLWAWTLGEMLTPKFFQSLGKEGFIKTYTRGHRAASRGTHDVGGRLGLIKCKGVDQFGNRYYEDFDVDHKWQRRWVEYSDYYVGIGIGGDRIPPGWHGWLAHAFDESPEDEGVFVSHPYIKEHTGLLSGTAMHHMPRGSPQDIDRMAFINETKERKSQSWTPPKEIKFDGKKLLADRKKNAFFEDTVKDL